MKNSRRNPFAAVAVIAIGLVLSGAGYAAASTAVNNTQKTEVASAAQIEEGKKLFLSNCASCHGVNGVGTKAAPTLIALVQLQQNSKLTRSYARSGKWPSAAG